MRAVVVVEKVVVNIVEVEDMDAIPDLQPWYEGARLGDLYMDGAGAPPPADIKALKAEKNSEINAERERRNTTSFPYKGKHIACDRLSRSDIDGAGLIVAFTGAFPPGFGGAWKTTDNTYVDMPDVETFKEMYAAMTHQGGINFYESEMLKAALALATTEEEVRGINWQPSANGLAV